MEGRIGRFIERVRGVVELQPVGSWVRYERRIPGFRERMLQVQRDLEEGKGSVLLEDMSLVPVQEYFAQQAVPQASEQVLIDNTTATDSPPVQE